MLNLNFNLTYLTYFRYLLGLSIVPGLIGLVFGIFFVEVRGEKEGHPYCGLRAVCCVLRAACCCAACCCAACCVLRAVVLMLTQTPLSPSPSSPSPLVQESPRFLLAQGGAKNEKKLLQVMKTIWRRNGGAKRGIDEPTAMEVGRWSKIQPGTCVKKTHLSV